ncbi:MAG: hypothetical protein M3N19_06615, partial [Candidatus Eremiobacteraeota bacterium]|nr:hypothetical protein [Candidatus Eremiobacteraeota bacterium]
MMDPFEQSADMRLLELQRKALGKEAPARPNWTGTHAEMNEAIPLEEETKPVLSGARLTVDLAATPNAKLIQGAVVTLSLAVHSDGDQPVTGLNITVPVPGHSAYRPGSLSVDGRALSDSQVDAFFGAGYLVERLEAGQRLGFVWKISVLAGTKPLVVAPRVASQNSGITGGSPILLARALAPSTAELPAAYRPAAPEVDRPFYELDDQEHAEFSHQDGQAPKLPDTPLFFMPDLVVESPVELGPQPAVPSKPATEGTSKTKPKARPKPKAKVKAPASESVDVETTVPQTVAAATPAEPRLYSTFDKASLGIVKKLFTAESFGQVPHYILQNSLMCSLSSSNKDLGIRAHISQQAGLLSRALLMHKLNKTMHVAEFSAGKTDFDLLPAHTPSSEPSPSLLFMSLT